MSGTWTRCVPIKKFTVVRGMGPDHVSIDIDFPSPFPAACPDDNLSLKFECAKQNGVEYLCEHFDLEPKDVEVIDVPS